MKYRTETLEVKNVKDMGRGVFALREFKKGHVIEYCPVALIPIKNKRQRHITADYSFPWNEDFVAISLGYGSLYNHSFSANAYVVQDENRECLIIKCHKTIQPGEQIFINYGGGPDCKDGTWFADAPPDDDGEVKQPAVKQKKKRA